MSMAGAGSVLMAVLSVPSSSRRRMPASPSPASSSATTSSRRGSAARVQRIDEGFELRIALGEAEGLGVGAAEVAPDLDHAVGGRRADLLDVAGDLLGEGLRQLLLHLVLVLLRLHLGGDDRQHAVAQIPDVLGDEHEADAAGDDRDEAGEDAADDALADARRHVGELTAHEQHGGAGDAAARIRAARRSTTSRRRPCWGRW